MKKDQDFTKDYLECLNMTSILITSKNKNIISADELFCGVFKYISKFSFKDIFRKVLGIKDTSLIQEYINSIYGDELYKKESTRINDLLVRDFDLDQKIIRSLNELSDDGIKKFNFLSLLYSCIENISVELEKIILSSGVDYEKFKYNLEKLLFNESIEQLGVIKIFKLISSAVKTLNIDQEDIELLIDIDSQFLFKSNEIEMKKLKQNSIENFHNTTDPSQEDTQINSNIKKEEKKLTIEYFGTNLTKEASQKSFDKIIGRDKEINQIVYTLLRKTKNNPLLIGEAGVGKTAIVEGLATKIVLREVPDKLRNKQIYMLDIGSLLAGTKYRGEFEARLKSILDEASDSLNNIILFIDEIHTIIGAGNAEGSADAANMLKPLLSRGKIQLIGATTFDEYQKHIEKDPALKRRFQEINVEEPSFDDTIEILKGIRESFENFHGVNISDDAIEASVNYSTRYILNKFLPDKAIDLIDEACARSSTLTEKIKNDDQYLKFEKELQKIQVEMEKAIELQDYFKAAELKEKEDEIKQNIKNIKTSNILPKHLRQNVGVQDIGKVLSDKLGIPADDLTQSEIQRLKNLDGVLKNEMLGQDTQINDIIKVIKRNKLSAIQRKKPIASFVFLGPSGVGKTFVSKLLAKYLFGDEKNLIRVDMSEYTEKYSISKLIGSAPGYVGYEEGGGLTEQIRRKPYSIILFDEIEKASSDVLNILLQILDEGHLKDNKGRYIDFKNTIIILTSNIGSEEFAKETPTIGFNYKTSGNNEEDNNESRFETIKERIMEQVKDFFVPELLNRFDKILIFNPLSKKILTDIFKLKYNEFISQWIKKYNIKTQKLSNEKIKKIIDEIYDTSYGARPIERYIQDNFENDLIEEILKNDIKK